MKTQLLTTIILFFALSLWGKEVTMEQARSFAYDFLNLQQGVTSKSASIIELSDAGCLFQDESQSVYSKSASLLVSRDIYAFNINEDEGFILISGNDATKPVLGYSYESSLDVDHMSPSVEAWLGAYKEQIRYVKKNDILASESIAQLWDLNSVKSKSEVIGVEPLITSKWNQSPFYNDSCPYDSVHKERALTGCTATAMAQVMNYWEHPKQGKGIHTYTHPDFGVISANFGATTYDWAAMPDTVNGANAAVATLCHHCGVAVEMDYGVDASGAWTWPVLYPDQISSFYALQTYFSYDTTIRVVRKVDFSGGEWANLMKRELDLHHPIMYSATSALGGHAFICDGYDAYGFFHINWGWGGHYDGYFLLDILDSHGKGAGPHAYSLNQGALIGIQPTDKDITLSRYENMIDIVGDISIDTSRVNLGEGFTVSATVNYKGDSDYLATIFCGFLSHAYQASCAATKAL